MTIFLGCLGILLIIAICAFAGALFLMLLWNWIAAGVFSAPELTYWQAFGLALLLSIIGGYFKRSGGK